jgi:hypothetical protein
MPKAYQDSYPFVGTVHIFSLILIGTCKTVLLVKVFIWAN